MTVLYPILEAHGPKVSRDATDLAFVRLGALLSENGRSFAAIARLSGWSGITRLLEDLECLHRGPEIDDLHVIREATKMLESLRDMFASIPADIEFVAPVLEQDHTLVATFDASVRFAGARIDDMIATLKHLPM